MIKVKAITVERAADLQFDNPEPIKVEQPSPGVFVEHHMMEAGAAMIIVTPSVAFALGELAAAV